VAGGRLIAETLRLQAGAVTDRLGHTWHTAAPEGLQSLIDYERCPLWLYRKICDLGLEDAVPAGLLDSLQRQSRVLSARNLLVDAQAVEIHRWLAQREIPHIFLKGIALRASAPLLPYGDARATNDVDVLVPPDRAMAVWEALQESGYRPVRGTRHPAHHVSALWNEARVAVEIHTSIAPKVDALDMWERTSTHAHWVSWNGERVPVPSPTDMLWHTVVHAMRGGMSSWRLRYFQDAAVVLAASCDVEWEEIERRLGGGAPADRDRAFRWLASAAALAGVTLTALRSAAGVRPCNFPVLLGWRHWVATHFNEHPRVFRVLLEGASHVEAGLLMPDVADLSAFRKFRRMGTAFAGQLAYRSWCALGPRSIAGWTTTSAPRTGPMPESVPPPSAHPPP